VANVGWPLLPLAYLAAGHDLPALEFWQIYYLTTPHRWITLLLVLLDGDRREGRAGLFAGLAVAAAALVSGVWLATGSFRCLLLVDFVWNAWHFGAQHAGIARIYGRRAGQAAAALEKHLVRGLVVYTILQVPGWPAAWLGTRAGAVLGPLDVAAWLVAAWLVVSAWSVPGRARAGHAVYVTSVALLYAAMLAAVRQGSPPLRDGLFVAAALMHATEYLAIVTHYARGRASGGSSGAFQDLARTWGLVLVAFVVVVGTADVLTQRHALELAVGLNLAAALLHYAYDGLIWRLRRPATAQALGASV
jgi:hypothetical protein